MREEEDPRNNASDGEPLVSPKGKRKGKGYGNDKGEGYGNDKGKGKINGNA